MEIEMIDQVLEGLLFVSGSPLSFSDITDKLEIQKSELRSAIQRLKKKYSSDAGIHILEFNDKLQLASNPAYADIIASVLNPIREKELTRASMETAAIIAYRQPITKLEIEQVRGVSSDYAVSTLLKQRLVEVVGKKDAIGKPSLFGTTDEFLKKFNLKSIDELPDYDSLIERINELNETEQVQEEENLYGSGEIFKQEEVPVFLEGEEIEKIE